MDCRGKIYRYVRDCPRYCGGAGTQYLRPPQDSGWAPRFHDPTEDTLRLPIPDDWASEDLGPHALRGRSRTVQVDAVSRVNPLSEVPIG